MIIVMERGATEEQIRTVEGRVRELGYEPHRIVGVERNVIGAVGHEDKSPLQALETMPGVESVIPILRPFKLVGRELKPEDSVLDVSGVEVGGRRLTLIAGPCSVESREQILDLARAAKASGAQFLRGGAFKPRTSPYAFQGLGEEGLGYLQEARAETGLRIVTEVLSVVEVERVAEAADVLQIGARNCQNYALLNAVGEAGRPVLFKRGMSTTISEFLQAAEYLLRKGNYRVMLCERGIRTFETATRFTLDLNAVPVIKQLSHLPVIVDPSHGTGNWRYVAAMSKAAVAAGADGLMIEIHDHPDRAFSDGSQSLKPEKFARLVGELRRVAEAVDRTI